MAEKTQIIDAIEALAVHCRPPLMSIEQREMWMRDWCADLAKYPADAIANACRKWRHGGQTKFPTPGQLMPIIRESLPTERGQRVEPWRELSDAEYQQLSIREKMRHRQILAHEARGKAGPMFRNLSQGGAMDRAKGEHIPPDAMPETHRHWTSIAEAHEAEYKRLRDITREEYRGTAA